jgi:oligoendopeptidase F
MAHTAEKTKLTLAGIMTLTRSDVDPKDCWNLEAFFPSLNNWEETLQKICGEQTSPHWPTLAALRGSLKDGPEAVKRVFEQLLDLQKQLVSLYSYAHMRHDEDIAHDDHKGAYARVTALLHALSEEASWIEPELLSLPEETLTSYLKSPILAPYRFFLEKIVRLKKHTLSESEERLLALAESSLQGFYKSFNAINDADFTFEPAVDSKGKENPITHALYSFYLRGQDRTLRKNSFQNYYKRYGEYENTLCELLNGLVQKHRLNAKARHFDSCLDAALFPHNIDKSVYHALIEAVHRRLGSLHDYQKLRKKVLKLDELHMYDVHVSLLPQVDLTIPYQEAEQLVIESVAPLGKEYQDMLRKGLETDRWVDRYENKNKRSGAYSGGAYDSMPYILMNYKGTLRDLFTLAHEAGHSMHSLLSHANQPYHYSDYSIFVAEVASTFNEELLMRLMLKRAKSKEERAYLINQKIEDIRSTLFRQTMFAEFELMIHTFVEEGRPLTPKLLREEYRKLNVLYFGPDVVLDPEIDMEWARIPHFYYNFYVYQYATGISAALALAQLVVEGGDKERNAYLGFLKSGSSDYPIEILKQAGVDMCSPAPVEAAIGQFDRLVKELSSLL